MYQVRQAHPSLRDWEIAFVDRERVAFTIADVNLNNIRAKQSTLCACGQMFGAGKTAIGERFADVLKGCPEYLKLLEARHGGDAVSRYLGATYIPINLLHLKAHQESLGVALAYLLYTSISFELKYEASYEEFQKQKLTNPGSVLMHFLKRYPGLTLFLHWDEMSFIEYGKFDNYGRGTWPNIQHSDSPPAHTLVRYYDVWKEFASYMVKEDVISRVFTYCSGPSPGFGMVGLGLYEHDFDGFPPQRCQLLVLPFLSPSYIQLAMEHTEVDSKRSLLAAINIPPSLLKFFLDEFYVRTGGVPRLVTFALKALYKYQPSLDTKENIISALDFTVYDYIWYKVPGHVVPLPQQTFATFKHAYMALVVLAMLKIPIPAKSKIMVKGVNYPVLFLLSPLNLHYKDVSPSLPSIASCLHPSSPSVTTSEVTSVSGNTSSVSSLAANTVSPSTSNAIPPVTFDSTPSGASSSLSSNPQFSSDSNVNAATDSSSSNPQTSSSSSHGPAKASMDPSFLIEILVPEYVLREVKKQAQAENDVDIHLAIVEPFLRYSHLLLGSEPLEWVLRCMLALRTSMCYHAGTCALKEAFFFLRDSRFFAKDAVCPEVTKVVLLPGISREIPPLGSLEKLEAKLKEHEAQTWSFKVHPDDWPLLFKLLLPDNVIGNPAPQSSGVDMLIPFKDAITAYACKLYRDTNPLKLSDIKDEIDKAKQLLTVKPVCLIIPTTSVESEIKSALAEPQGDFKLLRAGSWFLHKNELHTTSNRSSAKIFANTKPTIVLDIPERMEVVLLGKTAFSRFLGAANVEAIETLLKDRKEIAPLLNALADPLPTAQYSRYVNHNNTLMSSYARGSSEEPSRKKNSIIRSLYEKMKSPKKQAAPPSRVSSNPKPNVSLIFRQWGQEKLKLWFELIGEEDYVDVLVSEEIVTGAELLNIWAGELKPKLRAMGMPAKRVKRFKRALDTFFGVEMVEEITGR